MSWMRKPEPEIKPTQTKTASETSESRSQAAPVSPPTPRVSTPGTTATIGASVELNGELVSSEDLTIEGKVQGKITIKGHSLTIGDNGHVRANVNAKSVVIAGQLKGKVSAADKVEIASTGSLRGDVVSPRVAIADGAQFKGAIDMEGSRSTAAKPTAKPKEEPAAEAAGTRVKRSA